MYMILNILVFLLTSCYNQIISLEDNKIACLETNCSDYQQTKQMYSYDSTRLGDLTNKQFTLQFFVKLNPYVNNSFIAQVKTGSHKLQLYQSSSDQIIIKDTLNNHYSGQLYQIQFQTNNWLSIYITNKRVIVRDYGTFRYVEYKNFAYSSSTTFKLFNNGREHWQGSGCCIIFYLGISYLDSYNYILYNNKKPETKLVIYLQKEYLIQQIIFDRNNYSFIERLVEIGTDGFAPVINKDNLSFSDQQYIYANDVQLNQQFTIEFKIALPSSFNSNVVLFSYSLTNWNLYIFLNQTQVTLKQNNFTKSFTLISQIPQVYYHFCFAVSQTLEETYNYYYTQFYQFSDSGILVAASYSTYQTEKIPNQTNGVVSLGSKENQFQNGDNFSLYRFELYDGFFLDKSSLIDNNCAIYLNDRCISFILSSTHENCHPNCLNCSGSSISNCNSCMEPKTLNTTSSSCECPQNYYLDISYTCSQCSASCSSCTDGSSCLSCAINRVLTKKSNKTLCPCMSGYYEQDTKCMQCSIQCSECLDQDKCTLCPTTRELKDDHCVCKSQFYETQEKQCQQCPHLCQICNSDTICQTCLVLENLVLKDSQCSCKDEYYLTQNNQCIACKFPCKHCSNSQICTSCNEDRVLIGTNCLCLNLKYEDDSKQCQQCKEPCVNCINPGTKCLSCDKDRFLYNDKCYCNQGYFENADGQCQVCMSICVECVNESSCTKCPVYRVQDQCRCEDGYYEQEQQCNMCPKRCLTCDKLENCTSCKNTMQLINNECICLKGTYSDGNNCLSCNTQLGLLQKSCDMIKNCGDGIRSVNEECDDGNQVNRDGCSECKIDHGYQCLNKLLQQSVCYKCQEKCRKCNYINSNIVCLECMDGYFIQNNNCILCSQNCNNCTSLQVCTSCPIIGTIPDQDGKCPECQIGEQLQDGTCRTVCGDGIVGQGEGCDFGQQNGQGGCSLDCKEAKGFYCYDNVCNKIPEKQIEGNYVNTTTKTKIQINYNEKASQLLCQSFQIRIDNFTQDEFNYTFSIENEKCNFQFNFKKTITESNLIRIIVPQALSRFLDRDPREIVIIPRRQIYYSEQQVEQSKNIQSAQNQFKMLIQLLGPILAILGGFSYYLTILDILSWINNLYYINIQFPLNVQLIFQNSPWDDIQLFPSSLLPQFNQPSDSYYRDSPPHFLEKGTGPLFINNTFQIFCLLGTLILGYFMAQLIIKTLSRKSKISILTIQLQKIGTEQQYLQQVREQKLVSSNNQLKLIVNIKTKCQFFVDNSFCYFIKLLNLCYLDLVSAIALQLYCFDLSLLQYKMILLNYVLAYTSVILCLYLLKLTWIACNQHLILLKSKKFMQIYGTLFENLKTDDQSAILYPFINLIRKSAYVITVVYFYNKPLFQTGFSCLISFINVAFIICYNPFDSVKTLIQYGVPDFCIFLLMLVFTICAIDDRVSVLSDNTRYTIGWLIISIILISIVVQLFFIMKQLIKDITHRVYRLVTKIKSFL